MSDKEASFDKYWTRIGWGSFAVLVLTSSLLGFLVLSRYQENSEPLSLFAAICRAIGIPVTNRQTAEAAPAPRIPTDIAWSHTTLDQIRGGNAKRGEFVALSCAACHAGSSVDPAHIIPTLDGMEAEVIFKQLADYRSGRRSWGVMNAIAKALSVQDSADVAAYFANRTGRLEENSGERIPEGGRGFHQSDPGARLVFAGDPKRGIAPCSACHGPGGYTLGAPTLAGQYAAYIERQIAGFAQGIRQNDIYEQMRAIARRLKPDEMQAVATFYGSKGRELAAKN